jgi:hypothetical protein
MNHQSSSRPAAPAGCRVAGHGLVECRASALGDLRSRAAPAGAPAIPNRFLRHADEHTVVGLHAVLAALAAGPSQPDLSRHAVVAAPCQSGRLAAARTLAQLQAGGAVTVSPHVVPQCSLHSVAGAVSVALGMHGPHLGVGGGPDALAEGLLAATTLLLHGDPECTAAWLVATDWDEEPALDPVGNPQGDPVCRALAVQLVAAGDATDDGTPSHGPGLVVQPSARQESRPRLHDPAGGIVAFARALAICQAGTTLAPWAVDCPWGAIRLVDGSFSERVSQRAREAA